MFYLYNLFVSEAENIFLEGICNVLPFKSTLLTR